MNAIDIRNKLIKSSDQKTKDSTKRFFKTPVKTHGVKSQLVGQISKEAIKELANSSKDITFSIAEDLFKSGYCEEAWVAASLVLSKKDSFSKSDFKVFERWIDTYIDDWAKCDVFCNHTMWSLLEKYPEFIENLKKWAQSSNMWMKRAAAVSLIIPAKNGEYLKQSFELADILLLDQEDLVQKGYGWLLKEQSRKNQKAVYDYVVKHKKEMPRTALRYAIELMPENLRKQAMARD